MAFFYHFWEIFCTDEIGKKLCGFGKKMTILGKNSAIFSKIEKVYLLNWDFSANWEYKNLT